MTLPVCLPKAGSNRREFGIGQLRIRRPVGSLRASLARRFDASGLGRLRRRHRESFNEARARKTPRCPNLGLSPLGRYRLNAKAMTSSPRIARAELIGRDGTSVRASCPCFGEKPREACPA